jgi:hypothetical protein
MFDFGIMGNSKIKYDSINFPLIAYWEINILIKKCVAVFVL